MTIPIVILLGVWAFAVATALAKNVAGYVMLIAFIIAIITSLYLLHLN